MSKRRIIAEARSRADDPMVLVDPASPFVVADSDRLDEQTALLRCTKTQARSSRSKLVHLL